MVTLPTDLVIAGMGVPPYCARGIDHTLEPVEEALGHQVYAVDGSILDLSAPELRLYRLVLTCTDLDVPAMDGIWPGFQAQIDCAIELCRQTTTAGYERTAVPGSERSEAGFDFYRPRLAMTFIGWSVRLSEWERQVAWQMEWKERTA